jgi:hypothetical protein
MMKNRKLMVGIAMFCLLLVAVVIGVLSFWSSDQAVSSRLPDGTSVHLERVLFGTNLNFTYRRGPAWVKRLAPIIPDTIERRILQRGGVFNFGILSEPALGVALEYQNARGNLAGIRLRDDQGNRFDTRTAGHPIHSATNKATFVWILSTAPRRSALLHLEPLFRLPDGTLTNLGPFEIKNPWYAEYPQWIPEPIPQSRTNRELSLTLNRLTSGRMASRSAHFGGIPNRPDTRVTRLEFATKEAGDDVYHYSVHSIRFSDATGNRWDHYPRHPSLGQSSWMFQNDVEILGELWPGEDAWKIEVGLIPNSDVEEDYGIGLPTIRLPAPNSFLELNGQSGGLPGRIESLLVLPNGTPPPTNWAWMQVQGPAYSVGIKLKSNIEEQLFEIRSVTDEKGVELQKPNQVAVDGFTRLFIFRSVGGATSINLNLGLPEIRKFEFIARPEFLE